MPRSEAQKRADAKYKAKTYKTFTVNMKIADYAELEQFCEAHGVSKAAVLIEGGKMYMQNYSEDTEQT